MKELVEIQSKLKAPKDNYNSFGKYKYRSAESILESVKPLLKEYGCILTVSVDIVMVGDIIYVKATATISNEKGEYITTSAFAREAEVGKNGMDVSQVTGATSSYARKYALNGLFCIDDTKDTDTEEYQAQKKKAEKPKANEKSDTLLMALQEVETASSIEQLLAIRNAYFNLMSPNEQTEFTNKLTERKKKIQG